MDKKTFLDNLHYQMDKQQGNLELAFAYKNKVGNPKWSKWRKYLDAQGDEKFLGKVNNRTILPNEIVIDIEEADKFPEILEQVKKDFQFYSAYHTGSKGNHIHLWFDDALTPEEKKAIIQKYGADEQKAVERCLIALENFAHWKTGTPKTLIEEKQGTNNCFQLKKEIELKNTFEAKQEIIDLLNEEDLHFQYLDLGEVNGEWYFGFKIKGREAIITSSGKIYRNTEIKTKEGVLGENEIIELFSYEGNIGDIAPIISKDTIKRYYLKKERNHLISVKEIYQTIRNKILYYMDFSGKDEIADVLTCWVIATYCYPIFYWFPHLLFNAPSQSGKSKGATIVSYLSFRGFDLGASSGVTPAQIFRTLEGNRGTILIDEFEQTKGNQTSDMQQLVNQLLNASASKDAYVIRNEKLNNGWVAKKFHIFCPKIACNISGINPTSLSRYISFSWLKTSSEKGKRKPYREKDKKSFSPIREDLYILILENYHKIKEMYEGLEIELSNRDEDNWLPLFAIAKFIDGAEGEEVNAEEQLKKYLENYKELQVDANDDKAEFFRILLEKASDEERYYTPKEIGSYPEITELFTYLKSPAHKVGKLLKDYKFQDNRRAGGVKKYLLSKTSIKKIIDLYFSSEIIAQDNTNNTNIHKQHINTQEIDKNVSSCAVSVVMPLWKREEKTRKCCGMEFEENGQSFLCGQLWKGNQRKYCPNCSKNDDIDFSKSGIKEGLEDE